MDGDIASHLVDGPDPFVEGVGGEVVISYPELVVFINIPTH